MRVVRIDQRTMDDCAICTVAMVLGDTYEQVFADRWGRYAQVDNKTSWWELYFDEEGRRVKYLPLAERKVVQVNDSNVLGVLGLSHPTARKGHVVVLDELGVVDPATGLPEHMGFARWRAARMSQGFVLDSDFLAVSERRIRNGLQKTRTMPRAIRTPDDRRPRVTISSRSADCWPSWVAGLISWRSA